MLEKIRANSVYYFCVFYFHFRITLDIEEKEVVMPNWCSNILTVEGSPEDLNDFLSKLGTFTFDKVIPFPNELEDISHGYHRDFGDTKGMSHFRYVDDKPVLISADELVSLKEKFGATNGRDWSIAKWGTKWDIDPVTFEPNHERSYSVSFDTAWSPPIELVRGLAVKYPNLTFTLGYIEPGCSFAGEGVYKGHRVVNERYTENMIDAAGISDWHSDWVNDNLEFDNEEVG